MIFDDHKTYGDYTVKRTHELIDLSEQIGRSAEYHNDIFDAIDDNSESEFEAKRMLAGLPPREDKELFFSWEDHDHDEECSCKLNSEGVIEHE